jgi:hypothetical protein
MHGLHVLSRILALDWAIKDERSGLEASLDALLVMVSHSNNARPRRLAAR